MGLSYIKAKPGKSLEQISLTSKSSKYKKISLENDTYLLYLKVKKFITFDCFEKRTHLFRIILNSSTGIGCFFKKSSLVV